MMTKSLRLILGLLFLATTVAAQSTLPKGNTGVGVGKPMPEFSFTDVNGKQVTKASLPKNQPVILFYFDPDCDHCQEQTAVINEHMEYFKGVTFLWVSWGEVDAIKAYQPKYLPRQTGVHFWTKDTEYKIDTYFGYSETPSVYVYNRQGVRAAAFRELTKPEVLLKFAWQ
jgi:cytochrome oxidase Cu insertion factor (SCO1/SenC/PrrC family)